MFRNTIFRQYLVISDVHSDFISLKKICERHKDAEALVCAGDLCPDGYDFTVLLSSFRFINVRGNMDNLWDYKDLLLPLPSEETHFALGERTVYLSHGHLISSAEPVGGDIVISGHTHVPRLEIQNEVIMLNPGSLVRPRGGSPKSYAIMNEEKIELRRLEDGLRFKFLKLPPVSAF